eukprot:scaffold3159_cov191-Alexandrium_tamarense.AAC.3
MDNTDLRPGWASAQLSSTPEEDEENFPEIPSSHSLESNMPSYKRTCPHRLFRCYKFITMMTAFLVMVAQALSVVCVPFDGIGLVIKVFLTSFCVLIILNELEWWKMLRDSPLFSNWIARGENNLKEFEIFGSLSYLFIETASWLMFTFGVLYVLMGLFCCQLYQNKLREDYSKRMAERKKIYDNDGLRGSSFFGSDGSVPMSHWEDTEESETMV